MHITGTDHMHMSLGGLHAEDLAHWDMTVKTYTCLGTVTEWAEAVLVLQHKSYLLSWLAGDGRGLVFKCSPNLLPWFDMRSPVALLKDCSSDRELPTLIDDDVLLSAMQAEVCSRPSPAYA